MIIRLDGEIYTVTAAEEAKLIGQFREQGLEIYEKQTLELQLLAMPIARWILSKWEAAIKKVHGKEVAAQVCRPGRGPDGKKIDPVIHLSNLMSRQFEGMLKNAELEITTDGQRNATGFALSFKAENQGRGPVVLDGNEREREDNRVKVS